MYMTGFDYYRPWRVDEVTWKTIAALDHTDLRQHFAEAFEFINSARPKHYELRGNAAIAERAARLEQQQQQQQQQPGGGSSSSSSLSANTTSPALNASSAAFSSVSPLG